jgi:RNA polymerase sigma factor (sigma-70 family)
MGARRPSHPKAAEPGHHTFVPQATRILSHAEEKTSVDELCRLRQEIDDRIRPVVERLCGSSAELEYFDQLLAAFDNLSSVPASERRWVARKLQLYNARKQQLVIANLPWVTKVARSQPATLLTEEDLFQEGVCGLLKAIDRFEASRGLRLMTYATWYIREAMQQSRARHGHLVSLSAHDQTLVGQLESRRSRFLHEHGRQPTPKELAEEVGKPTETIARLQTVTNSGGTVDFSKVVARGKDEREDPMAEFDRVDSLKSMVKGMLEQLTSRERLVITMRFGLEGSAPTSLEALGEVLRLSKERVRQLQRQAIRRMQSLLNDQESVGFVA